MNTRTTQGLVVAALALFLFIVLFEQRQPASGPPRGAASHLFPRLDPRQVTSLRVRQGTNEALVLERGTNTWFFRAPWLYPAQPESVERFLRRLAEFRERGTLTASEVQRQTNGLAAFGLAPPVATVVVVQAGERSVLDLGRPTAIGGQVYARLTGREGLLTLDAQELDALPPSADAWRDRTLIDTGSLAFDRLQVRPLTNGFEVVRDPTTRMWEMTRPLPTRANSARLEFLVQDLSLLRVVSFVQDDPAADLTPYGLQSPQRELAFALGSQDILTLQIGQPPPDQTNLVHVRRSGYGNVVLVPRQPLAPWIDVSRETYHQFCDRRLMIFNLDQVDRLTATVDETFTIQRTTNRTWQIVEPYLAPADDLLLLEAFAELASLEFLAFEREVATDFTGYGLAPPRRQYRLEQTVIRDDGPAHQVLAQVDFGNPTGHRYYARRSLENSVVLALDPVRLPRAAFQVRDRRIWSVTTNQLAALTISEGARLRRLVRTGPMEWTLAEGPGGPPNPITLEEAAYRVGQLRAERWVAVGDSSLTRYGFTEDGPRLTLELKSGPAPQRLTLRLGRFSAAGRRYAAVTLPGEPGPLIFECPPSIHEFILSDLRLAPLEPAPEPGS
jgi:hypothetical protein